MNNNQKTSNYSFTLCQMHANNSLYQEQIAEARNRLADRKRKIDELDKDHPEHEEAKLKVEMFEAKITLDAVLDYYPQAMVLHHARAQRIKEISLLLENYLDDRHTPILFQRHHVANLINDLPIICDDCEDLLSKALKPLVIVPDDEKPDD